MIKSGIYKIRNKTTGKFYIGSAKFIERRFANHRSFINRQQHPNIHLQRAILKYGVADFEFIILEYVEDYTKLLEREQFYIDTEKPEYNILQIAGSRLGMRHSKETRLKISNSNTPERNLQRSITQLGKPKSEEHKSKIGISNSKPDKWPHADGNKCKCDDCRYLRNQMNRNAPSYPWGKFRHV